jgi:hypothetical protein
LLDEEAVSTSEERSNFDGDEGEEQIGLLDGSKTSMEDCTKSSSSSKSRQSPLTSV